MTLLVNILSPLTVTSRTTFIDCVFEDEIEMAEGESRSVYFLWRNCSFVPLLSDSFCLTGISLPFHATSVLLLNFFTSKESHNFSFFFSSVSGCRFWSNKAGGCVVYKTNKTFNCIIVSTVDFRAGIQCHTSPMVSRDSILAPSLNTSNNTCFLQGNSMLFSCRAARPSVIRVCPCRSYRKEQVALCESCWRHSLWCTVPRLGVANWWPTGFLSVAVFNSPQIPESGIVNGGIRNTAQGIWRRQTTSNKERGIRHFHVVVVQRRPENVQKKCATRAALLFYVLNIFSFFDVLVAVAVLGS